MIPVVEKKTEAESTEKNRKKYPNEVSFFPESTEAVKNLFKMEDFLRENVKQDMKLLDRYFQHEWFRYLDSAIVRNPEIKKIVIVTSYKTLLSTRDEHPLLRLENWNKYLELFKKSKIYKDRKIEIEFVITENFKNDYDYHDRFLLTGKDVWNITSIGMVSRIQRADMYKLGNPETIARDQEAFKELYESEGNFKINGKSKALAYIELKEKLKQEYSAELERVQMEIQNREIDQKEHLEGDIED